MLSKHRLKNGHMTCHASKVPRSSACDVLLESRESEATFLHGILLGGKCRLDISFFFLAVVLSCVLPSP